jgi:hypothetical protein
MTKDCQVLNQRAQHTNDDNTLQRSRRPAEDGAHELACVPGRSAWPEFEAQNHGLRSSTWRCQANWHRKSRRTHQRGEPWHENWLT